MSVREPCALKSLHAEAHSRSSSRRASLGHLQPGNFLENKVPKQKQKMPQPKTPKTLNPETLNPLWAWIACQRTLLNSRAYKPETRHVQVSISVALHFWSSTVKGLKVNPLKPQNKPRIRTLDLDLRLKHLQVAEPIQEFFFLILAAVIRLGFLYSAQ